ncbi:MAG: alanine racemase [Candidatus Caenarcaniphilales bacterium]|jgi:alanine racemase|nr:alanine racemase [Candidatus Caenarcaniphilales bacterium]
MVQLRLDAQARFRRDAWIEINLNHLEYNIQSLYAEFKMPLMPVLKADAYGHGATVIAQILDSYDFIYAYGVASADEALTLRQATNKKIVILGISPEWSLEQLLEHNIDITIASLEAAVKLNDLAKKKNQQASIHIKLDTGMNRIGFAHEENINLFKTLTNLHIESIFTHFADPYNLEFSLQQKQYFEKSAQGFSCLKHPGSSPALRLVPGLSADIVRVGIELYGLENPKLKPLLSLYSRISFVKKINAGETVSYKLNWQAQQETYIATLPLGYADGLTRALSNKLLGYCKGQVIKQVGNITMDQVMFDLGLDTDIKVGDVVEIIGPHRSVSEWAKAANTISYEIVCNLNLRLPKTYTRD